MDFSKLLDLKRIFEASPGAYFKFRKEFLIFFGALFVLGVALRIYVIFEKNKILRKFYLRIKNLLFLVSILGLAYLFFRSENIYLFSGRFILIAILLTFIVWTGIIAVFAYLNMPKELAEYKKQLLIKKYLPKKKK